MRARLLLLASAALVAVACTTPQLVPRAPFRTGTLDIVSRVEMLDTLVREPMVVEHPSGALFVAGYNRVRPGIWKSVDHGVTWKRLNVGTSAEGALGNSDVDLAVSPGGVIYFAELKFNPQTRHGEFIAMGVSRDAGATWHWQLISQARGDDRPWIVVSPRGVAHVIWNDGHGVSHATSRDDGATWVRRPRISAVGGSSHMAIGPQGEIAVRIAPGAAGGSVCDVGADRIAISVDDGESWQTASAPGTPRDAGCLDSAGQVPRWVDPIAWDSAGGLYSLWTTRSGVFVGRSADRGATWATWKISDAPRLSYYPYLVAGRAGTLGASWVIEGDSSLKWRAARVEFHHGARPTVNLSPVLDLESWRGNPPRPEAGGEYLATVLLRDGTLGVVTPVQNERVGRFGFNFWRFNPGR